MFCILDSLLEPVSIRIIKNGHQNMYAGYVLLMYSTSVAGEETINITHTYSYIHSHIKDTR